MTKFKEKMYQQWISIGYNCESAFRFDQKYNLTESSLFTWANSHNIETLLFALSNLHLIFKNPPKKTISMWECPDTKIRFHGKEPKDMSVNFQNYSEEEFEPYQKK